MHTWGSNWQPPDQFNGFSSCNNCLVVATFSINFAWYCRDDSKTTTRTMSIALTCHWPCPLCIRLYRMNTLAILSTCSDRSHCMNTGVVNRFSCSEQTKGKIYDVIYVTLTVGLLLVSHGVRFEYLRTVNVDITWTYRKWLNGEMVNGEKHKK